MKRITIILFIMSLAFHSFSQTNKKYLQESQEEFDQRIKWFIDAQYGMFIHFGLYSQLGGIYKGEKSKSYAEWIQANSDIPKEEYVKLLDTWEPCKFNADKIVRLAKESEMKYLVATTKHHEGFCLYDSEYTDYDIASTPMKGRDFIKELADACQKHGIRFGTYYSIIDWHHPSQTIKEDEKGKNEWGQPVMIRGKKQEYVQYIKNQVKELIENYDTDILWFDGDWANWWTLEDGDNLYQYIRELKSEIIINNRVSKRKEFKKDFGTPEQFHPNSRLNHVWEACYTLNKSWGYKSYDDNWESPEIVYEKLKDITEKGGNLLLNIGPDGEGKVPKESVIILKKVGKMIKQEQAGK